MRASNGISEALEAQTKRRKGVLSLTNVYIENKQRGGGRGGAYIYRYDGN